MPQTIELWKMEALKIIVLSVFEYTTRLTRYMKHLPPDVGAENCDSRGGLFLH